MLAEAAVAVVAKEIVAKASGEGAFKAGGWLVNRLRRSELDRATEKALRHAIDRLESEASRLGENALLDETFLRERGAGVLARFLLTGPRPRTDDLVREWAAQFSGVSTQAPPDVMEAASGLLKWFEDGLRREQATRALLDSRMTEQTATSSRVIADRLADQDRRALIRLPSEFDGPALDHWTSREWLEDELDDFLTENTSGYFVLEGAAGLGKSTFLAWLARRRGYMRHFVGRVERAREAQAARNDLAAQIAAAWDLTVPASTSGPDVRPDEFEDLLSAAAHARDVRSPGRPIVLVIDALNEVEERRGPHNVLGLPRALPRGVYIVVSQQPVDVTLDVAPRKVFKLRALDKRNVDDLGRFVETAARGPGVAEALDAHGMTPEDLKQALIERSEGVWIYAHHVLAEIELGTLRPDRLDELPQGVWQYYARAWRGARERHPNRWRSVDVPLLTTVAAAREPLALDTAITLAGVEDRGKAEEVVNEWRPYLTSDGHSEPRVDVYHEPHVDVYHHSWRSFLAGEDIGGLTVGERGIAEQLRFATRRAHERIADHYLNAFDIADETVGDLRGAAELDRYGTRHLVSHLIAADRGPELRRLLRSEIASTSRPVNAWATIQLRGGDRGRYAADVVSASQFARRLTDHDLANDRPASSAGDEFGYALLAASVNEQTLELPTLRVALVREGVWTETQALDAALRVPDPEVRALGLTLLLPQLTGDRHLQAQDAALAALSVPPMRDSYPDTVWGGLEAAEEGKLRVSILATLAETLAGRRVDQAIELTGSLVIGGEFVLEVLLERMTPPQLDRALAVALAHDDATSRTEALRVLAPRLETSQVETALSRTRARGDDFELSRTLRALAPALTDPQLAWALDWATERAESEEELLLVLAAHLSQDRKAQAFRALHAARYTYRKEEVRALARQLTDAQLEDVLARILNRESGDERLRLLESLAPHLAEREIDPSGRLAHVPVDPDERLDLLVALAPCLRDPQRREAIPHALRPSQEGETQSRSITALAALAPHLSDPQRDAALALVARRGPDYAGRDLLISLVPWLSPEQADVAFVTVRDFPDGYERSAMLAALAGHVSDERRDEALALMASIERDPELVLAALAPHVSRPALDDALELAVASGAHRRGLAAIASYLSPQQLGRALAGSDLDFLCAVEELSEHLTAELVDEALLRIGVLERGDWSWKALAALEPHLTGHQIDAALTAASAIESTGSEELIGRVVDGLAPRLSDLQLDTAVDVVISMDPEKRATMLYSLAAYLDKPRLMRVLDVAATSATLPTWEESYSHALGQLAAGLPPAEATMAFHLALSIDDPSAQATALAAMCPSLPPTVAPRALDAILDFEDLTWRARALSALAPRLQGTNRRRALREAISAIAGVPYYYTHDLLRDVLPQLDRSEHEREFQAAFERACEDQDRDLLGVLVPHLTEPEVNRAFALAGDMSSRFSRRLWLTTLVPALSGDRLLAAFEFATPADDTGWDTELLAAMAPRLDAEKLAEAIDQILSNTDETPESVAQLKPVVHHMSESELHWVFALAVAACTGQDAPLSLEVLAKIYPRLGVHERDEVLTLALPSRIPRYREQWAKAIHEIAGQLTSAQLDSVLVAAGAISEEASRVTILNALAPHLSLPHLDAAVSLARGLRRPEARTDALIAIVSQHARGIPITANVWRELLAAASETGHDGFPKSVSTIIPLIRQTGGPGALNVALEWLVRAIRWWH